MVQVQRQDTLQCQLRWGGRQAPSLRTSHLWLMDLQEPLSPGELCRPEHSRGPPASLPRAQYRAEALPFALLLRGCLPAPPPPPGGDVEHSPRSGGGSRTQLTGEWSAQSGAEWSCRKSTCLPSGLEAGSASQDPAWSSGHSAASPDARFPPQPRRNSQAGPGRRGAALECGGPAQAKSTLSLAAAVGEQKWPQREHTPVAKGDAEAALQAQPAPCRGHGLSPHLHEGVPRGLRSGTQARSHPQGSALPARGLPGSGPGLLLEGDIKLHSHSPGARCQEAWSGLHFWV